MWNLKLQLTLPYNWVICTSSHNSISFVFVFVFFSFFSFKKKKKKKKKEKKKIPLFSLQPNLRNKNI